MKFTIVIKSDTVAGNNYKRVNNVCYVTDSRDDKSMNTIKRPLRSIRLSR